jgi:hypothetical protein
MLDVDKNNSSLQYSKDDITKNRTVILTILALCNYSGLYSKIECRSNYHHVEQKISQLEVLFLLLKYHKKNFFL